MKSDFWFDTSVWKIWNWSKSILINDENQIFKTENIHVFFWSGEYKNVLKIPNWIQIGFSYVWYSEPDKIFAILTMKWIFIKVKLNVEY